MLEVRIPDHSTASFEKGMRIFKKICQKDGFMMELRERKFYKKPSEKRRDKLKEALRKEKNKKNARRKSK